MFEVHLDFTIILMIFENTYCYRNVSHICFTGGIIALGVFGGFVFLAAIITTIVIMIRR